MMTEAQGRIIGKVADATEGENSLDAAIATICVSVALSRNAGITKLDLQKWLVQMWDIQEIQVPKG